MCAFGATLPAKRVTVKVSKPPNSADFDAAVRVGFGAEVRARTVAAGWLKSADSGRSPYDDHSAGADPERSSEAEMLYSTQQTIAGLTRIRCD
jgi:hypothetical protein